MFSIPKARPGFETDVTIFGFYKIDTWNVGLLSWEDARHVVIIHTNKGGYGRLFIIGPYHQYNYLFLEISKYV